MFQNIFKLSSAENDKDFYRLFFIILCILNISFHYLFLSYAPQSYDPVLIRLLCSGFALLTVIISFWDQRHVYYFAAYTTLLSFLLINNCYYLGENNFTGEYFLGSLLSLLFLGFFCRRSYEFVAITLFNLLAFCGGLYFAKTNVEVQLMIGMVLLITGLASLLFLFRRSYILRSIKVTNKVLERTEVLAQTKQLLKHSTAKLHSLTAANGVLVFEFNADQVCTGEWYQGSDVLYNQRESFIGADINELQVPELANHIKVVQKTLKPVTFEMKGLFGNTLCYKTVVSPVFDDDKRFTGYVTIAFTDINELKNTTALLKENELLLYNEQVVAKLGSWWSDVAYNDFTWSNNLFSILEVSDIPPGTSKLDYYISLVHPDDRDGAKRYFAALDSSPLIAFEHRLITPRGTLKYFKVVSGYPVKDDRGTPIKLAGIIQDITDSKVASSAIKASQTELMEVQAMAKIGGWQWDVKLNDLQWGDEIYRIYEVDKEDVVNENHVKLLLAFVHPDDKEMVASVFKNIAKPANTPLEYRIITAKRQLKYINLIVGKTLQREGVVRKIIGTLQDVTDGRRGGVDYERTENKYKNVLENVGLAALTIDKQGDIMFCNKHLADILGYEKNELLGMNWVDTFVPEAVRAQFKATLGNNSFYAHHTSPIVCRDGRQRTINWKNTVTHDEYGNIAETTSLGEDVTDVKKAREALIMAKENAEKASRFKSEFLSIMSHEIRTPMNAVIGTTNLLLQDNPAQRQLEYLHTLQFSSNNLLELINDILDYNKIEAGKLELYKLPFNIQKLAQNLLQSFTTKAEDNGSRLELVFDKNIPANLVGDQLRLGQILNNLLSNAVKFTQNGKVYLKLESQQVRLNRVAIKFTVADTGIGIAAENVARIFDPFTQEYQSTQSDYGGTGLGLAITKRLVELHNSTIVLNSSPGEGTEFSFAITFEAANIADPAEYVATTKSNSESSLKGMSILLVDDNKMNLLIANKFLKNWEAKVQQATDGKMAVELAMANNYDLILMDLQMPIMDGFEAAAIIKQTQPDTPIIALSADAMPETSLKATRYGMDDYMTKPFVPEVLFGKISRYYKVRV